MRSWRPVSVPLRGKEGAGRCRMDPFHHQASRQVSVPLRGKEGAGRNSQITTTKESNTMFPSPCGVRRVRDAP